MKKTYITSFITIFFLAFISVAFAAFNSELTITGEATVLTDTTPPTCGSWYLRDSSLTTQQAYDQNKFINAGSNTTWTNTNKTLFIECTDNMDGEYGCINVDAVNITGGKRYFKDVKDYTTSIKTDNNTVTVTLKDAYQNERTCTLPVGGSNPYVDKQGPTVTITRTAANKFTYSATDDMSSVVTTQYMVTTSSTQPSINDSGWSTTTSEVTIDQTAAKTYYVWAKDGVNITHQTINTYKLTKTQGTGTILTLKYNNNSGAELNTSYVVAGTPVYVTASANNGYGSLVLKKDSTSISSGSTQTISAATTISSSATPNVYSVTLNNQSATSGGTTKYYYQYNTTKVINNVTCYYYTDSALTECLNQGYYITSPEKTGYTFGGYYTSTNGGGTQYIDANGGGVNNIYQKTPNQIDSSYTTNINLYAKWTAKTYTLTLNKNDGTSAGTTSLTATYNSSSLTPTTMSLASKSFTISGFGTAAARNSDGATVSSTSALTSTATLNGYYTATTGGSLIVAANTTSTYNSGTVSGYLSSGTWVRDANTNLYAQFGAMPSKTLPTITKTGYTCGWTTSESETSIQYQSGGSLIPTGNTTLYGVCVPASYTIAYTMNNGNDPSPKPTSGTYNSDVTIGTTSAPTKSVTITGNANNTGASVGAATVNSQTFTGWSSSSGAGLGSGAKTGTSATPSTAWNGSATTNKYFRNLRDTSGTITLTANWGGSSTLPTVTKTGYTCGWYDTNGTSGGNYIGSSGGSYTVPSGSSTAITVYARCTPNVYTITLNQQSGSGGTGTIYEKYDDGYYLTYSSGAVSNKMSTSANGVTVPTRSGYTFGGYYTSTGGAGTQYIDANGKITSSASASQFSSSTNTLYAKWTINQYTVTCKDYFVDASDNLKVLLGSSTKSLDYGSSVSGATWGTTTTTSTYYGSYSYHGSSAATTVPANNDLVVYRYFYAWTDLNVYYASGSSQSGATVEFKVGSGSWVDVTNESNTIQPWGTTYYVRNIRPKNATEEFSHVNANLVWDSTNQYYSYTPTAAGTSMNIYMKYKIYTITLDKQSGSGGTGTIYEKYNTGYYTDSAATTQMTTSANPVSVPTRTGYTFGGYYTSTGGAGTQYIDANGKLTSSASTTQFSANGSLYAHWTPNTYTIAYTMNNGTDPNPKPTSGTYDSDVVIGTTSGPTKSVTITGNANNTGASVGSATVNSQTFTGWSSGSGAGLGSGAKTGTSASPSTAWNGSATTNKYYKNLRDTSGTITLTANWGGSSTLPTVTKTGYTCSWYDASGTSGGNYVGASGGSYSVSSGSSTAVTVYARCTPNVYTITLNQQSGSGGTGTIYEKYDDGYYLTYSSGAVSNKMSTSANGVTIPSRNGYTFGGYYTGTSGSGTQYIDANGKITSSASASQFSSNGSLYAKWTPNNYTVTYNHNYNIADEQLYRWEYDEDSDWSTEYGYGEDYDGAAVYSTEGTYTGVRIPITENNKTNTDYRLSLYAKRLVSIAGNLRVYAPTRDSSNNIISYNHHISINDSNTNLNTWKQFETTFNSENYSTWPSVYIDYDTANQGPIYVSQVKLEGYQTANKNTDEALGALPTPQRIGYTLNGWYTAAEGGTQISSSTTMPPNDVSYYAHWAPNTYTIIFDKNSSEASSSIPAKVMLYDEWDVLPTSGFTRPGYAIVGWSTNPDGTGDYYYAGMGVHNLATSGSVTLYAQWEEAHYQVGTEYYVTIGDAINRNSENGATIVAIKDYSDDSSYIGIYDNTTYTLNTNGKSLTYTGYGSIESGSTFNITGYGIINFAYGMQIENSGTLTISDVTLYSDSTPIANLQGGNTTLNSGKILVTGDGDVCISNVGTNTTITINGGRCGSEHGIGLANETTSGTTGTINVYGGEVIGLHGIAYRDGNLTIGRSSDALSTTSPYIEGTDTDGKAITYWDAANPKNVNFYNGVLRAYSATTYSATLNVRSNYRAYTYQGSQDVNVSLSGLLGTGYETVLSKLTTVTADANGGSIPSTSEWTGTGSTSTRQYNQISTYGDLPTPTKTGYTFVGWGRSTDILPTGLTRLLSITSTGTQYIDTGVVPDSTTTFDIDYRIISSISSSGYGTVFGSRISSTNYEYHLTSYSSSSSYKGTYRFGNSGSYNAGMQANSRIWGRLVNDNGIKAYQSTISGSTTSSTVSTILTTTSNQPTITIFALHQGSSITQYGKVQLYYFNIYKSGVLIRSFIPCRNDTTDSVGLYDLVNDVFYVNNGSGTFTAGAIQGPGTYEAIYSSSHILPTDHTIKAIWTPTIYTISLQLTPGLWATNSIYEKYNNGYYTDSEATTQMTTNTNPITPPTRNGYTFGGYYTGQNGTGTKIVDENGYLVSGISSTMFTSDTTLYAKWTEKTYTITIKPNGGVFNGTTSNTTWTKNYSDAFDVPIPTRTGYSFTGWDELETTKKQEHSMWFNATTSVSIYNNNSSSVVQLGAYDHTLSGNPLSAMNEELRVMNVGGSASKPGLGGFVRTTTSAANRKYIHVFVAKLPVGYYFHFGHNSVGTGYSEMWLTSNEGTGQYQTYAYQINAGSSGTFSTFGHVYVSTKVTPPGNTAETGEYTSYVAYTNIFDVTSVPDGIGQYDGTGELTANWKACSDFSTEFSYTGSYQKFTVPNGCSGYYKLEAWGAQGGDSVNNGGESHSAGAKGAYTSGNIYLSEGQTVYVYVGQRPGYVSSGKANNSGGWNGGGTGTWDRGDNDSSGGGGGATDFRIFDSNATVDSTTLTWNNAIGLRYRVMVAAGGSGNAWSSAPGPGGALESSPRGVNSKYATQTSGNAFGVGGASSYTGETKVGNAGGGGGYWGGYAGEARNTTASGQSSGGSSYISGYTGSVAVISNAANTPRYGSDGTTLCANGTTDNTCSIHFTGTTFTNTVMTAGDGTMPTWDGTSTMTGNTGHGHAKITFISLQ